MERKITKADDHWVMINWLLSPSSDPWAGLRERERVYVDDHWVGWLYNSSLLERPLRVEKQEPSWWSAEGRSEKSLVILLGILRSGGVKWSPWIVFLRRGVAESRLWLLHAVCLDFEPFFVCLLFGFCLLRARILFSLFCSSLLFSVLPFEQDKIGLRREAHYSRSAHLVSDWSVWCLFQLLFSSSFLGK